MADKEVGLKITADTSGAVKTLGDLEKAVENVKEEVKEMSKDQSLEQRLQSLNKEIAETPVNIRAMNKQIQEYQAIALEAGRTSPVGKAALQQAAQLKDRYIDIQNEVKRLADDGMRMQAAIDVGTGVIAGYTAFQGALALTGVESEELQKTMVKLQAAQSVLMGVEQIRTLLEKESTVVLMAKNIQEKIATFVKGESAAASGALAAGEGARATATAGATAATSASTGALKLFRLALVATGIGAIVVGLGLLIANFDKVTEAVKKSVEWLQEMYYKFQNLGAGIKIAISVLFPFIGLIYATAEALEYFGVLESKEDHEARKRREAALKDIKEKTKERIKQIQKEIDAEKARSEAVVSGLDWEIEMKKAAGEDYRQLEKEKIQAIIETTKKQAELLEQQVRAEAESLLKINKLRAEGGDEIAKVALEGIKKQFGSEEGYINNIIGTNKDLEKLKDTLDQAEKDLIIFNIEEEKLRKDSIKKASDDHKAAKDKQLEDQKKHNEELLKEQKRIADELQKAQLDAIAKEEEVTDAYRKRQLTDEQKEIDDLQERLYKELEMAGDNNDLKLLLEEEYQANVNAVKQKYTDEWNAKEKELLDKAEEEQKKHDEEVEKGKQEAFENRLENAEKLVSSLDNLNKTSLEAQLAMAGDNEEAKQEIRKKAFKRQKALDIADATIQGIKAVQSALASPFPLNIALAAINGATAAANIAKIASVQFEGESGATGGGNLPNTGRATNGANIGQVQNTTTVIGEPQKVYVTEQDISNTQGRVRVAESQASL